MKRIIFFILLFVSFVIQGNVHLEKETPSSDVNVDQVENSIKVKELTLLIEFSKKNYPGVFTIESIQEAEVLDLSNSGIRVKDMPGIKYLPELKKLNLMGNKVKNLDVSFNRELREVVCPLSLKKLIRKNNPNLNFISVGENTVEVN